MPNVRYSRSSTDALGGLGNLAQEAHKFLEQASVPLDAPQVLAELAKNVQNLTESERAQLSELVSLIPAGSLPADLLAVFRRNAEFSITPAEDEMTLCLEIRPPVAGGRRVGIEDVLQWLKSHEIRQGVDLPAIRQVIADADAGQLAGPRVIVRGRPPQHGQDASFELFVRSALDQPPQRLTPADLAETSRRTFVCAAGDRILRLIPATAGTPGYTATGRLLPARPGAPCLMAAGPNVRVQGQDFIAAVGGQVVLDQHYVSVRPLLVITEDLTAQSPPIQFDGEVEIRAAVRSGARVVATSHVTVHGPVEDAYVESTEGDVRLHHGLTGRGRGTVRAGRNVTTRFVENGTILAKGDITIEVGSLHSHLTAWHNIVALRGRGQIAGGIAMAGHAIDVKELGNSGEIRSQVLVGLPGEAMGRLAELDAQIRAASAQAEAAAALAERITRAIGDPAKLARPDLDLFMRLRQMHLLHTVKARTLSVERQRLLSENARGTAGRINVHGELQPGVDVRLGAAHLENREVRRHCRLLCDPQTGRIVVRPLL